MSDSKIGHRLVQTATGPAVITYHQISMVNPTTRQPGKLLWMVTHINTHTYYTHLGFYPTTQ